jgi:hypothetical protein
MKPGGVNYIYLLIGLIGLQFWVALAREFPLLGHRDLIPFAFVVTLLMGVWTLVEQSLFRNLGIVLAVAAAIAFTVNLLIGSKAFLFLGHLIVLVFFLGSALLAFTHVLFVGPVSRNKISGVICVYLMMAMVWAILYNFLHELQPASFNGIDPDALEPTIAQFIYFSFVTLSTLGYGDVTPEAPIARFLAYSEATFGQFYIAIVVASLVSAYSRPGKH